MQEKYTSQNTSLLRSYEYQPNSLSKNKVGSHASGQWFTLTLDMMISMPSYLANEHPDM